MIESATDAGWFLLKTEDYTTPVGFITGDGTPMIISYNKNCLVDENVGDSDSTKCIAGIYDINGSSRPNRYGDTDTDNPTADIITINTIGGIGGRSTCLLEISGMCITAKIFKPDSTAGGCQKLNAKGIGTNGCPYEQDYWANAYLKCIESGGRLPNKDEFSKIVKYLYDDGKLNYDKVKTMGLTVTSGNSLRVWSNQPVYDIYAYAQCFAPSSSIYTANEGDFGYTRRNSGFLGVCVGK